MSKESSSSSGTTIAGLLGIAFVVLKLCKVIDWSWWYVTLPFWGGLALVLAILGIGFIVIIIKEASFSQRKKERELYFKGEQPKEIIPGKKSKFMTKLDEAMAASEKARNQKMN